MSQWREVPLGELFTQEKQQIKGPSEVPYIGLEHVQSGTGDIRLNGAGPDNVVGTSFCFDERHVLYGKLRPYLNKVAKPTFAGRCSTELVPLLPKPNVDRGFLAAVLRHPAVVEEAMRKNTGARMPRADMKALAAFAIPLPPLDEQRRIVGVLDGAARIVRLRRRALETARAVVPALFLDTFGDFRGPGHGLPIMRLDEVADIGSGITKGRKLNGVKTTVEAPYIRVANVQDGYLHLEEIKAIPATQHDLSRYALMPGDLLMTEGGDPDKLGRAAIWNGEIESCLHQNHVFRVRPNKGRILPEYLSLVAGSIYGKNYFLSVAKRTTGIASINKTQLSAFPVPVAPLPLQQTFTERLTDLRAVVARQERALAAAEGLQGALMARVFG